MLKKIFTIIPVLAIMFCTTNKTYAVSAITTNFESTELLETNAIQVKLTKSVFEKDVQKVVACENINTASVLPGENCYSRKHR